MGETLTVRGFSIMAKDPALLFYTSDFLTGTMLMTDEQVGKYIRLLCLQHQKGRLTEKHMLSICSTYDEEVFSKFSKDESGMYYNERLELEAAKRKAFTESRRNNASGGKKKGKKPKSTSKAYAEHMENENEDVIENTNEEESEVKIEVWPTFDDFWDLYDKKTDRAKCEKKWNNLNQEDKEAVMEYLPAYKQSTPDKKYRRNPETFLNNKTWENEIIDNSTKNNRNRIPQAGSFTLADFGYDKDTFG